MDLTVSLNHAHEGFCSFQKFQMESTRNCGFLESRNRAGVGRNLCLNRAYAHWGTRVLSSSDSSGGRTLENRRKKRHVFVYAASKVESLGLNGIPQNIEKSSSGHSGNGNLSLSSDNPSRVAEEFESNYHLRRVVRNGELYEAFKFLENLVCHGADIISCTSLIRGFCKISKTRKAARIMEILEGSGAVPDVITYNVLISGYCKAGEISNALRVLDRMSVSPDVVTYNTILRSLCDSGKLKQAMEVLDRQLQRGCYPDVITYTILIEATCKDSGVGQAMKLLDEMRSRGCTPDVVTYNVLVNGICKEGRLDEAIKFLSNLPSYGCQPNVITYNIILRSMCSTGRWIDAEKLLADMLLGTKICCQKQLSTAGAIGEKEELCAVTFCYMKMVREGWRERVCLVLYIC